MRTTSEILRLGEEASKRFEETVRRDKRERKELRRNSGGPCNATTKDGRPCRNSCYANGYCGAHGGKNAFEYQLELKQKRTKRAKRQCAGK